MKKGFSSSHYAYSMLELIFVIVILGIVSSIGSQVIVGVYESYLTQRALHRTSTKTELAISQIANRLSHSIEGTVIGRKNDSVIMPISNIPFGVNDYKILEWIGSDNNGFTAVTDATLKPEWSGYCDITASTLNRVSSPGSKLSSLNTIIQALSPGSTSVSDAVILFPGATVHTVGFTEATVSISNAHPVNSVNADGNITLDNRAAPDSNRTIKEHYKLAWSAYAIVPLKITGTTLTNRGFNTSDNVYDLFLYYDYQPWDGEKYSHGSNKVLLRNVSVFKFTGTEGSIRIKVCQRENVGGDYSLSTCKEKVIIR